MHILDLVWTVCSQSTRANAKWSVCGGCRCAVLGCTTTQWHLWMFGWCSWLSRQSNTLKVPSSILGSNISFTFHANRKFLSKNSRCSTVRQYMTRIDGKKLKKHTYSGRGSNSWPRACEARVITNYTIRAIYINHSTYITWKGDWSSGMILA